MPFRNIHRGRRVAAVIRRPAVTAVGSASSQGGYNERRHYHVADLNQEGHFNVSDAWSSTAASTATV